MKFISVVLANFKRHRIRVILTLLSIAAAFLLFTYLAAIREAFELGVDVSGADRLVVRDKVSLIELLPVSYESDIERIPGVKEAIHATFFGGVYKEPRNLFPQLPVEPEEYLSMFPEFLIPKDQKEAWLRTRTGAIVGRKTADRFGFKIGDRIPLQATLWPPKSGGSMWEFDLVGIYDGEEGTDTSQFLFHYDYFEENRQFGQGLVGWYIIRVNNPDQAVEVAKTIDAEFANSPAETKTETENAFRKSIVDQIGDIGIVVVAILSAVFFTILLVVGNTMAQAVRERTQELAVLKAVGFTGAQVLGLVLAESLLLAVIGGVAGLGLGSFLVVRVGDPTGGALPIWFLPKTDLVFGVLFIVLLGLAAGFFPALQAMRLSTVDALRRE